MKNLHNKYQKGEGTRELEPLQIPIVVVSSTASSEIVSTISNNYVKPEGIKDIQTFIVIFSGGEKREKDYFSLIVKRRDVFQRVKIEYLDKSADCIPNIDEKLAIKENEGGFSPDKLLIFAEHWIDERYTKTEGADINLIDSIYLISDVDHFITELKRIKPLCESKNLKLIISNSCFEKWLYYGYYSEKPDENPVPFSCPADVIKISAAFKEYGNLVVSGGFKPQKELYRLEAAIHNAKVFYAEDKDGIPTLYSTNMFILGEELLPLIKNELENLKKEREAKTSIFRKKEP